MKKLIYITVLWAMASCSKETLQTYDAEDNIYFDQRGDFFSPRLDSINFSFAYSNTDVTDSVFKLPVAVTGIAREQDRSFNVTIDPASTAVPGTHYDMPQFIIHAGKIKDTIYLRIKRAADLALVKKSLILHLKVSDHFKTEILYSVQRTRDTVSLLRFKLNISDMLEKGPHWDWDYSYYFGDFSIKKVKLMNELFKLPLDLWTIPITTASTTTVRYYTALMARYLSEQEDKGSPVYESDGTTLMKMGAAYQ